MKTKKGGIADKLGIKYGLNIFLYKIKRGLYSTKELTKMEFIGRVKKPLLSRKK